MEDNAMPKRVITGKFYSKRRKGRPRRRCLDGVESAPKMKVKGWKEMRNREQWRLFAGGPRLTQECSAEWNEAGKERRKEGRKERRKEGRIILILTFFDSRREEGISGLNCSV
jgi:hypothetical protein